MLCPEYAPSVWAAAHPLWQHAAHHAASWHVLFTRSCSALHARPQSAHAACQCPAICESLVNRAAVCSPSPVATNSLPGTSSLPTADGFVLQVLPWISPIDRAHAHLLPCRYPPRAMVIPQEALHVHPAGCIQGSPWRCLERPVSCRATLQLWCHTPASGSTIRLPPPLSFR